MKKRLIVSIIFAIIVSLLSNVYAASCNVNLQPSKIETTVNKEFVVDVVLSNIQDNKGMIALTATLDYNKNDLTFVKIEGQNSWKPSYNEENGMIAAEREDYTTNNEQVQIQIPIQS